MLPGPDLILACPRCAARFRVPTLLSGNTLRARAWTDGYCDAPMLPRQPLIARCRECDALFWRADAPEIGQYDPYGGSRRNPSPDDDEWRQLPQASDLDVFDFYDAIEAGLGDTPERERYLRTEAWWAANHAERRAPDAQPDTIAGTRSGKPPGARHDTSPDARPDTSSGTSPGAPTAHAYAKLARETNMLRLLVLIEDSDDIEDRLTRAELHRELGEFDLALAELAELAAAPGPTINAHYRNVARKIGTLAERGDHRVRRWP